MIRCSRSLLLLAIFCLGSAAFEKTPREALLVLSKGDHTLAIVDPTTLRVVAKAPVGEDPHEVIASSDGKLAYVSNYGGGAFNTITVIDLVNQKRLRAIDLGPLRGPHGLFYLNGKTWFTAEGAKAIARYDPAADKVDWILGTGQNRTHMIWVSADASHIYTTNVSSGTVSIIDKVPPGSFRPPGPPPGSNQSMGPPPGPGPRGPMGPPGGDWNETVVKVGRGSEGFDVAPNHKELWVANAQDGTVSIIDLASKTVTATLQADVPGANRLKFTPDGKLVFISCLGDTGVTVLDCAPRKQVKRLAITHAAGIQMQPDGARVYIASTGGNYVAVVDTKTLAETGRIDAGPGPDGLAWSIQQ